MVGKVEHRRCKLLVVIGATEVGPVGSKTHRKTFYGKILLTTFGPGIYLGPKMCLSQSQLVRLGFSRDPFLQTRKTYLLPQILSWSSKKKIGGRDY